MAWPWKKCKHQEKTSTSGNQQQMSDVTNDEQIEVQERVVLYAPILEGKSLKVLCSTKGECMVRWFTYGVIFIFF